MPIYTFCRFGHRLINSELIVSELLFLSIVLYRMKFVCVSMGMSVCECVHVWVCLYVLRILEINIICVNSCLVTSVLMH